MLINHEFSLCSRVFQRELTTCLLSIVNKYIFFFPVFCFHACWSKHCISRRDTSKWHNKGWGPLHCADKISTTSLIHQIDSHHIKVDNPKKWLFVQPLVWCKIWCSSTVQYFLKLHQVERGVPIHRHFQVFPNSRFEQG